MRAQQHQALPIELLMLEDEESEDIGKRTLAQAFKITAEERWEGRRSEQTASSQAYRACHYLALRVIHRLRLPHKEAANPAEHVTLEQVQADDLKRVIKVWRAEGLSTGTINKRLVCLSAMGVSVRGNWVRKAHALKWWLAPEAETQLVAFLRQRSTDKFVRDTQPADYLTVMNFIQWQTRVGLRVEESLRLDKRKHFARVGTKTLEDGSEQPLWSISVPGTKTATAAATLALPQEVVPFAMASPTDRCFDITYERLRTIWEECREQLAVCDVPTATLKSLRRSAARYLHVTLGMPIKLVQDYLRHENVKTTMEYLRLTGGISEEEYRRYM